MDEKVPTTNMLADKPQMFKVHGGFAAMNPGADYVQRLSLWTTDNQKAARMLYEKVGFSLVSETPNTTFAKDSNDEYWEMEL